MRSHRGLSLLAAILAVLSNPVLPSNAEAAPRQTVDGIGGFFFRAHDPKKLAQWYDDNFGITAPDDIAHPPWQQTAGSTAFTPFSQTSTYFDPQKPFELNFRVRDLDAMVAQLRTAGITVSVDPQIYPYGRFAHLADPEGNPIELWQPMTPPAKQ